MKDKNYELQLDIYKGILNPQSINFVTEDAGKCTLNIKLLEDKITPFDLTGCIVRMVIAGQQQDCIIEDALNGQVKITLLQSMLLPGTVRAELQIYDSTNQTLRLTTPTLLYSVRKSLMDDTTVAADPNYTILQNMILDVSNANEIANNAKTVAEGAMTVATEAQTKATEIMANGDYAKAQGDYAKAEGDKAANKYTLNGLTQTNFNFTSSGKALKSLRTGADEYFMPHTAEEITDKANHTQAEVNHTFYKQACKELTSAGTPITVNNGLKGYVLSAEIKGNTKVYKRLKGTQDTWVEVLSSEARDTVKYEYKLDSTKCIISNNETLYPIYANETDKTNQKVILCNGVGGVYDTLEIKEDGSGVWTQNIKEKIYTGGLNETWRISGLSLANTTCFVDDNATGITTTAKGVCDKFTYRSDIDDNKHIAPESNKIMIFIEKSVASTVEQFKAWLQANPTTVRYQLATPIATVIPKELMPTILIEHKINICGVESPVTPSNLTLVIPTSDNIRKEYSITLLNGYTQVANSFTSRIALTQDNRVELSLDVTSPATFNAVMFSLPVELRPSKDIRVTGFVDNIATPITIKATGEVMLPTAVVSKNVYLKEYYRLGVI